MDAESVGAHQRLARDLHHDAPVDGFNGPMTRSDRLATLEEANAQFQKSWDAWKAWARRRRHCKQLHWRIGFKGAYATPRHLRSPPDMLSDMASTAPPAVNWRRVSACWRGVAMRGSKLAEYGASNVWRAQKPLKTLVPPACPQSLGSPQNQSECFVEAFVKYGYVGGRRPTNLLRVS